MKYELTFSSKLILGDAKIIFDQFWRPLGAILLGPWPPRPPLQHATAYYDHTLASFVYIYYGN